MTRSLFCLFAATSLACAADSPASPGVCEPGATQACLCSGAVSGAQSCAADGKGWEDCVCVAPDVAPDTAAPPDSFEDASEPEPTPPPNVLLVIADDMGMDAEPCSGLATLAPEAPHLEALCDRGVRFEHAWAAATCSPTRATILTGRYPLRHGVTAPVGEVSPLPADEVTLPQRLGEVGVATANIGKWHLGGPEGIGQDAPWHFGWDHYEGLFIGGLQDYWAFQKIVQGGEEPVREYATTHWINRGIHWVDRQSTPWLLWLAVNAPHSPFHVPPEDLHSRPELGPAGDCPSGGQRAACHRAAIEALDHELGRLLAHLEADGRLAHTWVIFVGDNGSPGQASEAPVPDGRAKGSVYEGGVRVPLVIAGPDLASPGRAVTHPVDVSDLFATILELFGGTPAPAVTIDSVSLLPYLLDPDAPPQRSFALTQTFAPGTNHPGEGTAIRDARYKYIRFESGEEALYDLHEDAWESKNRIDAPTPAETEALESLKAQLDALQ